MRHDLYTGQKVRYPTQPEWGIGHVLEVLEEGTRARVQFPAREEPIIVSAKGGQLVHHELEPGALVVEDGRILMIRDCDDVDQVLRWYRWGATDGEEGESREDNLIALPPRPDLLGDLASGKATRARQYLLRRAALVLDDERRNDAVGALMASRVMVMPHQVAVVQRVLSAPRPRYILADEVGLGKTIEAGMIFTALRLAGLARRVLIVVPSHLTVQWLVEMFHKFNQMFTLMDSDRYAREREIDKKISPWARFPMILTSLEMLARGDKHREEVAEQEWDLVIFDEAHHLKGEKAFAAAKGLAEKCWGMLLLTATPLQLDPEEYRSLLSLLDPSSAPTAKQLKKRMDAQAEISDIVRALDEGGDFENARSKLQARFPEDERLTHVTDSEALLGHLAETYSLSEHLVRNRRVVVGSFSKRELHRHPVKLPAAERRVREKILEALGKSSNRGAVLTRRLKAIESSPAAIRDVITAKDELAPLVEKLAARDAKYVAFDALIGRIQKDEPKAKLLVFTESRATQVWLEAELQKSGRRVLSYHGDLTLTDRDRRVARFRDPDGPPILLSTEVGGEGRNFQFANHLVNYDLPWSPAVMEQRIGRLDRIGQMRPVQIHVFDVAGTLSADVLELLADRVGVFEETVGGLDSVLEEVEGRITELALKPPGERAAYAEEFGVRVREARDRIAVSYDPLLDRRSFPKDAVGDLADRAMKRLGIEEELGEGGVEDALWAVARDLDERFEEVVIDLARKVGIGVDTDEHVEAFECKFRIGRGLRVDALPGLDIQNERTVHGTFWRDTALEREEIEYFATGHPIVEALFGFLRDGPYGRVGARRMERPVGIKSTVGVEFLYHLEPPQSADTNPGAQVASRHLSRFFGGRLVPVVVAADEDGIPQHRTDLDVLMEAEGEPLEEPLSGLVAFIESSEELASELAGEALVRRSQEARERIEEERDRTLSRMALGLVHQGLTKKARQARLRSTEKHYEAILVALGAMRVELDSACAFVLD